MKKPRKQYEEYVSSMAETNDFDSLMSYQEWLEAELTESWKENGSPYL